MLGSCALIAFAATAAPEQARRFYAETLELPLLGETPFALEFDAGGTALRVTKVDRVMAAPYTVLGWEVQDIGTYVAGLAGKGVHFERYPGMSQDELGIWRAPSGAQVAWFKDPDGNVLSLTQFTDGT